MAYVEHELDRVEVACDLGSMALFGETVFVVMSMNSCRIGPPLRPRCASLTGDGLTIHNNYNTINKIS
jgi:hypothetical protein